MGQLSKGLRFEILARDGFRCRYCGMDAQAAELHVDHVLPRALGGRDDAANLVTACIACNFGKSDRKIIALPAGFALTPDKRPGRLAKAQRSRVRVKGGAIDPRVLDRAYAIALGVQEQHVLDCGQIDSLDEIDEDNQLALVWCDTHEKYEWHSIPLECVRYGGTVTRKKVVTW